MNRCFLLFFLPLVLFAQQNTHRHVTPEQIQQQLSEAEAQYEHALKLFNPWYTGPIITPSATMVAPGTAMWQPYIYFTDTYGAFNEDRQWVDAPNNFTIETIPVLVQIGITPSVDTAVIMSTVASWQQDQFSGGFNDIKLQLGFKINEQTLYAPKAKFTIGQTFPTGKYQNLDPENLGLDATGAGAWKTSFTLAFGKVIFWDTLHPVNARVALSYIIPTPIHVSNFNSYGGGYGTKGTVHPGNSFNADLGLEVSINQPWVAALDVVYTFTNRTTFNGHPGTTTPNGSTLASVGSGYSDQLSLAPAIEYNFNDYMGILWGVWFPVYGRNSSNFISGIFSWYWSFPSP